MIRSNPLIQAMKMSAQTLRLGIVALALSSSIKLEAGTPPDHSWNPSRPVNPPYGLDDVDGFNLGNYDYCRFGNMQDSGIASSMNLNFTRLSEGTSQGELEVEHYLQNTTQIIPFSSLNSRTWTPATGLSGGHLAIVHCSSD